MTTLHIDSTLRKDGSVTRRLTAKIVDRIGAQVIRRDLSDGLPGQSDDWLTANWTPADERSDDQKAMLAGSDELIAELKAADTIVIGVPIYNFSVSAGLKAWIDLVCRAGITFNYSPDGPVGLLQGKKAILAVASGGYALQLSLRAAGVGVGDKVLTNAFTLSPVPGAIVAVGAVPVLVETNAELTIDLDDLRAKMGESEAGVLMLSHMRGHIADMDALMALAGRGGVRVIEDCAHTMGATWDGQPSGTFGLAGCFS